MVKLAMGKKVQAVLNFHRLVTFFQAVVFWGSLRYADYKWKARPAAPAPSEVPANQKTIDPVSLNRRY